MKESTPQAATAVFDQPTMTRVVSASQTQPGWGPGTEASAAPAARGSSKTWLVVVGVLALIMLVCGGGIVGLFIYAGTRQEAPKRSSVTSPSETPKSSSFASPSPTAIQTTDDGVKTGTYYGTMTNLTYSKNGDLLLRVDSASRNDVQIYFSASNGLTGSSSLNGTMDASGEMSLRGKIEDGRLLTVYATPQGDTITGGYAIGGGRYKPEWGTFTATRR
ncbi:MAG: hypothetical protein JO053_08950 [Acidobacteria bacterium]|nr:hypothetical protein [Acidobacteriota bacterium]